MEISTVKSDLLAKMITQHHTERTGFVNVIGSVEKNVEALLPDILSVMESISELTGEKS